MLDKKFIIEKLESLREHKMAKDIFVPVLEKKGCSGVKFTGGPDEVGVDIEYYELTHPEKRRSYGDSFDRCKRLSLLRNIEGRKLFSPKNQPEKPKNLDFHAKS